MLVDDNEADVEFTLSALRSAKFANPVEVSCDGAEALAWIARWEAGEPTPVVILLDINMPKVNGIEVVRQLKAHPVLRAIPVVMLTTSSSAPDVTAAYRGGANSYIVKPVNFDEFTQVMAQIGRYWVKLNKSAE